MKISKKDKLTLEKLKRDRSSLDTQIRDLEAKIKQREMPVKEYKKLVSRAAQFIKGYEVRDSIFGVKVKYSACWGANRRDYDYELELICPSLDIRSVKSKEAVAIYDYIIVQDEGSIYDYLYVDIVDSNKFQEMWCMLDDLRDAIEKAELQYGVDSVELIEEAIVAAKNLERKQWR